MRNNHFPLTYGLAGVREGLETFGRNSGAVGRPATARETGHNACSGFGS